MYKFLTLFALVACIYAAQAGCPGCPFEDTANSNEVLSELKEALEIAGLNVQVKSINKVTKQVTGGMQYKVEFTSEDGENCSASWLSRPWESTKPLACAAACSSSSSE